MKTTTFLAIFFVGFTVSCSKVYNVHYDYDNNVNFANLKTYDWMPVPERADIDSLDIKRVKKAVNVELEAKGLEISSDNPDFLIAEHLGSKDKVNVTNWGYGYRGGFWIERGVTVNQIEIGSLILDFVDAKSKELLWRGTAKALIDDAMPPEKREKLIKEAVQEILKNFPPPPSK